MHWGERDQGSTFCTPGCPLQIPSYQHRAWAPGGAQKGTDGERGERKDKEREGRLSPTSQDWVMMNPHYTHTRASLGAT